MGSESEVFDVAGPFYLSKVDWNNATHRRCVAASLVQGAYVAEIDRQQRRQDHCALAPPWWESFGFQLKEELKDHDESIFGALYEFGSSPNEQHDFGVQYPPKFVIAFRGTLLKPGSWLRDLKHNVKIFLNELHHKPWANEGYRVAQQIGSNHVWLTGHSLGSSIALLVGRYMVLNLKCHPETYLFNPPFIPTPLDLIIKTEKIRRRVEFIRSVVKAGVATAKRSRDEKIAEDEAAFTALSPWIPNLFINASDTICFKYHGYFQHRERMVAAGFGEIGRVSARTSLRSMLARARGKDSHPSHLIPSANLILNKSQSQNAHKLCLWWIPDSDLQLDYNLYHFE